MLERIVRGLDTNVSMAGIATDTSHVIRQRPPGTGALDGQNIPLPAGRQRVRLNIRTFEYRFNRL